MPCDKFFMASVRFLASASSAGTPNIFLNSRMSFLAMTLPALLPADAPAAAAASSAA
jgi:hypothetical protein